MFVLQDLTLFGGTLPTAALYACLTRKAVFLCVRAIGSMSFFTKCSASTPKSSPHVRPYLRWRLRLAHGHKILRSECLTATRSARKATGSAIKLKSVSVSRCRPHVVGLKHRRPTWLSSDARFVFWERRMLKWKAIHYKWKTVEVGPWTSAPSLSSEATLVGKSLYPCLISFQAALSLLTILSHPLPIQQARPATLLVLDFDQVKTIHNIHSLKDTPYPFHTLSFSATPHTTSSFTINAHSRNNYYYRSPATPVLL